MRKSFFLPSALLTLAITSLLFYGCGKPCQQPTLIDEDNPMVLSDDISNQHVKAFAEDRYGQIWIATFRGLNKFDGNKYYQYFCTDDSTGLPDNNIQDIARDAKGRLWVATVNGVCQYTSANTFERIPTESKNRNVVQLACSRDGRVFAFSIFTIQEYDEKSKRFVIRKDALDPFKMFTSSIAIDSDNRLWHTYRNCLSCYSVDGMRLLKKVNLPNGFFAASSDLLDGDKLWIKGFGGVLCFDTHECRFLPLPASISKNPGILGGVNKVHRYDKSTILFSTYREGLLAYNETSGKMSAPGQPSFPFRHPGFKVTGMFTDNHHNLWMGSDDQGFSVDYQYSAFFNGNAYLDKTIGHQSVLAIACDRHDNVFISTKMSGLYAYNLSTNVISKIPTEGIFPNEKNAEIKSLLVDSRGFLWLVSGPTVAKTHYDGSRLQLVHRHDTYFPLSLTESKDGTVWASLADYNAAAFLPDGTMKTTQVYPATFCFMPCIKQLCDGRMLTAAFNQDLATINPRSFSVQRLAIPADSMKKAVRRSVFIPTDMLQTDDSTLYLGTVTNGLLRLSLRSGHAERIHGLSCSDIGAIISDREHNLWVSTMNGLNRIDGKTGKVTSFFKTDGTGGNQYNDRAACLLPNGELIFGGTHGLTFFNPEHKQNGEKTRLVFETLRVHNQVVNPHEGGCIDSIMEERPVIRLKHNQNSFGITYAALAYGDHERVNYAYKLEGFDNDWVDAGKRREAYYANLPVGHYTLKVNAHSKGHLALQAENEIEIIVCPVPWNSWWAWMVYIAIAVMILAKVRAIRNRIVRNKLEIQKAQQEKEHEKKVNAMNMSFFSNISHEFRTPLTMIAGPVGMLCDDKSLPSDKRKLLLIIQRSVARMLRLVNQLMDFNKLENDTLRLKVARVDIIGQLRLICDIFKVNAKEKDITMRMEGLEGSFLMKLDSDKLDKIVSNLLSNALKFTPKGGSINFGFDVEEGNAVIRVSDSGLGIPPSERENIFKRFYQLNNKQEGVYNWGTGIGLYFSRRLAELHHGSLTAGSTKNGHGATFTLTLPTDETIYSPDEQAILDESQQTAFPLGESLPQILDKQAERQDKPTVLVVDDDTEVVNYLQTLIMPYYNVTYKFDADSAYKSICENEPDIILCDVIMPGKNGYELCREVKANLQVCHIPMILVTAKATVENQVEGLNTGADAYITKPFDPKLMLAMIHSLLDNREKLKQLLTHSTQTTDKIEKGLSPQDKVFIEQLYHVMEEGLSNAELDVAHLTASLHVSRTKLYYKMKGLTGSNPSAFFKTYKLNRAAELIREGKYTISEVADMTGFSTPSHFSTSFKKQFGVSPSEYA